MSARSSNQPSRGNGRSDPVTGLNVPADAHEEATQRDWRIRAVGFLAALLIAIAALIYFFGEREFSGLVVILILMAALAAVLQSVLVLLEFRRK